MTPHTPVEGLVAKWRERAEVAGSLYTAETRRRDDLMRCADELEAALASLPVEGWRLRDDDVQWIVNDNAELGVKIGDQFFFCYKGRSLVYENGQHDDESPMHWRPVFKREFGECIHPVNYADLRSCGRQHYIGTVSLDHSDDWQPLPQPPQDQRQGNEQGGEG